MRLRPPSLPRPGRCLAAVLLYAVTAVGVGAAAASTMPPLASVASVASASEALVAPVAAVPPAPAPAPAAATATALACTAPAPHLPRAVHALQPLSAFMWPGAERNDLTRHFGGISGIDHDPRSGRWWLLSDDRSERAPARFYEATIAVGAPPQLLAAHTLRREDDEAFARFGAGDGEPADGEALRADPCGALLWWASEADPPRGFPAAVHRSSRDGLHAGSVTLPPSLEPAPSLRQLPHGPRANRAFEGLAFVPDGSALWIAVEAPLLQDGPLPTRETGALLRFTRLARDGRAQQYAYPLEPLPREGRGGERRADNGVSEILAVDVDTLLVVERAGHEVDDNVFAFAVRLYIAEVAGADNVAAWPTLAGRAPVAMRKRLLLDLADAASALGLATIDNIEAAAWGPRLPDGRATLLVLSDDNFSPRQATQWLWFAVAESNPK